ncbi:MAG: AsmA-like C-terminal domain-containing protein [Phycisphaerae bacterium]
MEGVTFSDVQVLVPEEKLKPEPAFERQDGLLLKADTFHVTLRRKGILGLKFHLGQITVTNPEFYLTKISANNRWNYQMLFAKTSTEPARKFSMGLGPPIILKNGRITFTQIKNGQRLLCGKVNFTAEALPQTQTGFYQLSLNTWTTEAKGPTLGIDFNPRSGEVLAGHLDTIELKNIEQTLPEPYKEWCRQFKLSGKIGISEINYKQHEKSKLILVIENVKANVPLSRKELNHSAGRVFLQLSDLTGKLVFTEKEVKISELAGKINNAPCTINGECQGYIAQPDNMTFRLHVSCKDFLCLDYTDPQQKDYIETYLPWKLRCFFHDFKPRGKVDFDLLLAKGSGPSASVTLAGIVSPKKLSVEYYKFPYRLDNFTGIVRMANGGFHLIGMTGFSDEGKVVVNGTISEASKNAKIDLVIASTATPLNKKLFTALPPKYQTIWKKFNLTGAADARVELHQPYGANQPWQYKIAASFLNASGVYEGFKYPLHDVTGILKFDNDLVTLENISGRHGLAKVTIHGQIHHLEKPKPTLDIKISAQNVSIDPPLVKLLPNPQGQILRDCQLSGTADLEGFLKTGADQSLDYNFLGDLKNSKVCCKDFPYPIDNLMGQLVIVPQKVVIKRITARRGTQKISGTGNIFFSKAENNISFKINADNLAIDPFLYGALNHSQQTIWNLASPTGKINVQAELNRRQNQPWDWKMTMCLQKAAIQYKKMDKVTDLEGQIFLSPGQVILKNITGRIDNQWPLEADGFIKTGKKSTQVNLARFDFDHVRINDDLLASMGGANFLKELKWRSGGYISGRLRDVRGELGPESRQTWDIAGKLDFEKALVGAFDPTATDFDYAGTLSWNIPKNDFAVNGNINLRSFTWNERQIENLKASLTKNKQNPTLTINTLTGNYAGGLISGMANLNFEPTKKTYGLQLTVENLDAGTAFLMNSGQKHIGGKMRGEIYLLGTVGEKYIRRGGGTLQITGAEALKIPLMAQIYQLIGKEPPNLATFHDITIQFILEQHKANLQHIELISPTLSLIGSGNLNLSSDRIGLDLIAATPKKLDKLPVIPELMKGASREIIQIEVRGPINNPVITANPLKDISETLKIFLEGKYAQ